MDKEFKPVYLQIVDEMKLKIVSGKLAPGEKLPSIRDVALDYKVNPNTVQRSFKELEENQLMETKRGIGSFVTEDEELLVRLRQELLHSKLHYFLESMMELKVEKAELLRMIEEENYG